jgi:hypothetical protein
MTIDDFYKQDHWLLPAMAVTETKQARHVHVWEEAYKRSFCMYRAMVRDACMAVHKSIKPDNISVGVENVNWLDSDEIILPIDDDDTYEPTTIEMVRGVFEEGVNLVVWPRRTNFIGRERIEHCTQYLDTCNWAIRKSFLTNWSIREAMIILSFHWVANGLIAAMFGNRKRENSVLGILNQTRKPAFLGPIRHESLRTLDKPLSTYYLHSGSISFLAGGKMEKHSDTVKYLRSLPLHPLLNV